MADKRGRNLLPSGKWADYVWNDLSEPMRKTLHSVIEAGEVQLYWANRNTVSAMQKRGLMVLSVNNHVQLTEDGRAMVKWMMDNERNR